MLNKYITPLNLSKLGFRYFRIVLESKHFSRKFINYLVNHPNIGYVFEGAGWSGKKRILGIGIWATSNAEITDIATHIRAMIPDSYQVVYQSELTRLEYFADVNGKRTKMVLIDELEEKRQLTPIEKDYLKLISIDGSLTTSDISGMLGVSVETVINLSNKLQTESVYYGVLENKPLPSGYMKFFIDTAALSNEQVEQYYATLSKDDCCIYLARGNGKYNLEFEYTLENEEAFNRVYKGLLTHSKRVRFEKNVFTNLFPQSKFLNNKVVQDTFLRLADLNDSYFDFRNSELWYVNHEGAQAYLDIYSDVSYRETMKSGETGLFSEIANYFEPEGKSYNLIDLGSGDGHKALELIQAFKNNRVKAYFPVDIQELELAQSLRTHQDAHYAIHPTMLRFDKLGTRFPIAGNDTTKNLVVLFGGTYGNFPPLEINSYIEKALKTDDRALIAMPIRDFANKETIAGSYLNTQVEQVAFGVLRQIGFKRDEFLTNKNDSRFILQPKWVGNALVQSFMLKQNKNILGIHLRAGTTFDIMSSWKPSLSEFKDALELTFDIEAVFKNKSFAIAVCAERGE